MGNAYRPKKPFKSVEGLGTQPWFRLSRNGAYALDRLYAKFNGFNRDKLSLTYGDIRDKMSNRLFSNAVMECIAYGFVDMVRAGRLEKNCNLYRISNRWRKLEDNPKSLDEIGRLLKILEDLKRKPGDIEKRMRMKRLREDILKVSKSKRV